MVAHEKAEEGVQYLEINTRNEWISDAEDLLLQSDLDELKKPRQHPNGSCRGKD
ncbi:hypothetical protein [Planococcus shenhongbingii]|uniref:Uncharacterized protein n=1 Tax=Planococcus shenhongbingii TaxID=3058398 RepID=A0ABT8NCH7_9BACL|nr:hypothetical protein [Planococcus sp. N017]MDN7245568.1 hypothetical protein [Planococcus sp. N017]